MKKADFWVRIGVVALTVGIPLLSLAQAVPPPPAPPATSVGALIRVLCLIINYFFVILVIVAILIVLFAAFEYLTAGGDPEKVKNANHYLTYAAVAIAVAILAKGFPAIVAGIVGTSSGSLVDCS